MELTSRMKMARFKTFWMQMRKIKPLDESQGQKWHFTRIKKTAALPLARKERMHIRP
ncbi:hypothetical protein Hanom_Chr11g01009791 [Helianthus anomalus]